MAVCLFYAPYARHRVFTDDSAPAGHAPPRTALWLLAMAAACAGGCASNTIALRSVPKSPLVDELQLTSFSGPKASPRTAQLLRVYNLSGDLQGDNRPLLKKLQAINDREPSADTVYAQSELAFLGAKKAEAYDKRMALDLYGAAVLHAYDYLFDRRFADHAQSVRSELSRRLRSVQRRVGFGA